jgi:hypothetical protein
MILMLMIMMMMITEAWIRIEMPRTTNSVANDENYQHSSSGSSSSSSLFIVVVVVIVIVKELYYHSLVARTISFGTWNKHDTPKQYKTKQHKNKKEIFYEQNF